MENLFGLIFLTFGLFYNKKIHEKYMAWKVGLAGLEAKKSNEKAYTRWFYVTKIVYILVGILILLD